MLAVIDASCYRSIFPALGERMNVTARTIIELNIKHYRRLLTTETDATRRETITKLLAEEEAKLAKLPVDKKHDK